MLKVLSPTGRTYTVTEVAHKQYTLADSYGSFIVTSLSGWHVIG